MKFRPSTLVSFGFSASYGCRGQLHHSRINGPVAIDFEIPVRKIIRLVPEHDGFNHMVHENGSVNWSQPLVGFIGNGCR